MATIFISGSRVIPYLPEEAKRRLEHVVKGAHDVVIGDSDKGVDSMVASFFVDSQYDRVSVYTTRTQPRLKSILPSWNTIMVSSSVEKKKNAKGETVNQRDIETEKDRIMGKRADFGFVIWKPEYQNRFGGFAVSKGSLRNMVQMLRDRKPVVLYKLNDFGDEFELIEMKSMCELDELVSELSSLVQRSYHAILEKEDRLEQGSLF